MNMQPMTTTPKPPVGVTPILDPLTRASGEDATPGLKRVPDIRLRAPLGVSASHTVRDLTIRAFFRCGESYTIHPIDMVDGNGLVAPLSKIDGLILSSDENFDWELPTRRLLTIPMAKVDLAEWANRIFRR